MRARRDEGEVEDGDVDDGVRLIGYMSDVVEFPTASVIRDRLTRDHRQ